MKKYIILNSAKKEGNGFAKLDFTPEKLHISINFNLSLGKYEVYIKCNSYLRFLLKEGNMGFTRFEKTLTAQELGFSPSEITSVFVSKNGETILSGLATITAPEKILDKWQKVTSVTTLPHSIKNILSHPHATLLMKSGKDIYIKEKGNKIYLAIKSEFGTEPHTMLYVASVANHLNGYWVVAFSKDTKTHELYDIKEPLPNI